MDIATLVIEVAILLLIAYEIWGQPALHAGRRAKKMGNTFELRLLSGNRIAPTPPKSASEIQVRIVVSFTTQVSSFNLRFVEGEDGGNISPSVIHIGAVYDRQGALACRSDTEGGCDCWWRNGLPLKVFAGKEFDLIAQVFAPNEWSGYLSFHGWDADDQPRYAREPFRVVLS